MLDLRVYRAAFVPLLFAVLVAAFSLASQPRAIGTSLAPDAFDGPAAFANLGQLTTSFGARRPGSRDDDALADRVARELRVLGAGTVQRSRTTAQTIDGEQELETVIATRPGAPGPGLVVVAHRDAAGPVAEASLSGTAALLELARVSSTGSLRRSITFVSTSGGSGGLAGARAAIDELSGPVDAVLVLGDVASRSLRKPWVVGWSNADGVAPLRLQRTVQAAVRAETGQDPGGPRAGAQWARLAFPMALGEQGAFLAAGLPAVLLSASGERPPPAGAAVSEQRLTVFGRSALRAITALDAGPAIGGPESRVVTLRKILPGWAVLLLVGTALLPVWVATVDGFARVRRRRLPVGAGLRWVLATAVPFLLVGLLTLLLGLAGLISARPGAPVPANAVEGGAAAAAVLGALVLAFAIGWLALRPALLRGKEAEAPRGNEHAAAVLVVLSLVTLLVWLANPWAAALLVLPAHAWLLALAPEVRLPRPLAIGLGLLALLPFLLAVVSVGRQLGYGPVDAAWSLVLMVAGGHVGPTAWLVWSVLAGAAVSVGILLAQAPPPRPERERATVRGPRSYAGPGSLGGTDSAVRR